MEFFAAAGAALFVAAFVLVVVRRRRTVENSRTLAYDERRAADNCRPLAHVTVLPPDTHRSPERDDE